MVDISVGEPPLPAEIKKCHEDDEAISSWPRRSCSLHLIRRMWFDFTDTSLRTPNVHWSVLVILFKKRRQRYPTNC